MKKPSNLLIILGIMLSSTWVSAAPVNINTDDANTIAANIKGVGAKKAAAIIQYRKAHGPFRRVDDIVKVKGIGAKLLEKNRADLLISPAKTKKN